MGLRCSVFGHTFSETDTRRDREVRGDEVVTVVKTIERCSSCGEERVVSENKEVVSVVDADDIDEVPTETTDAETNEETDSTADAAEPTETVEADDSTETEGTDAPGAADETAAASGETPEAPDLDPDADPEEEDVEFITETDGSLGGADEIDVDPDEDAPEGGIGGMAARSGAYGDSDASEGSRGGAGGASDGVPETGEGAEDEDAEIIGEEQPRSERAPGQWPDDPEATDEPWEPGELGGGPGTEPEPDETVPEPAPVEPSPAPGGQPEAENGSLHCPACGHTVPTGSSYRPGDACPECQSDYLESPSE